jgi:hypothetical protein
MNDPAEVRHQLLAGGYSPLPLVGKSPVIKNWQKLITVTAHEVDSWTRSCPAALNTGILTRLTPVLDVDVLDPEAAAAIERLAQERFEERGCLLVRFGAVPKRAIPFRTDDPFAKITAKLIAPDGSDSQRLELMCDGQQVVVDGEHPDTHRPYSWRGGDAPGKIRREDLPYLHQYEAQALVDDATNLLVDQFGYRRAAQAKSKSNGSGETGSTDWVIDFADHDQLTALAMKLLRTGFHDGAAVNYLRDNVQALTHVDSDRKARRLREIPGMVSSARAKIGAEGQSNKQDPVVEALEPVDLWPNAQPPVLPCGLLPARIEAYARAGAKVVGADVSGFAMAALAASAAAIPDAIMLRPMRYSPYVESARIWVALVGDPSARKSAILAAVAAQLRKEDRRRYRDYAGQKALWDALPKAEQKTTPGPKLARIVVNDTSVEAAQETFKTSTEGVFGLYDELSGWFGTMERYGQTGRAMADRSFWLQTYNGGPYIYDRVGRGSAHLDNISMTLLGGIQPDLMRKVSSACTDDGLIQRLMPVMIGPSALAVDDPKAASEMRDFDVLIAQLIALASRGEPLRFDDEAQEIRRDLEIEHHGLVQVYEGLNKKFSTALGKQDGVFVRLCIIWHCVENAHQGRLPDIIAKGTAQRVVAFMRRFTRQHLADFYAGALDLSDEHERLIAIAGYILAHKPPTLTNRQVQAAVGSMRKLTTWEITPVMETLEALGWLFRGEQRRAGAPPPWTVNPAVHARYAARAVAEAARRAAARKVIAEAARSRQEAGPEPWQEASNPAASVQPQC